ncbi:MAG: AAA family ATPase [Candidatus Micrarchaeaceae archaeon]
MSKKIILCVGLPGSGKSFWAKTQVEKHPDRYKRINRDDLRNMLDNGKWSQGREKHIKLAELALAELYLSEGFHIIVDDCNLAESTKNRWKELASKLQVSVEVQDFTHVPLETCLERDRHRQNYVGEQVIRKMYTDFLQPPSLVYQPDLALPQAIICDLDGTLALIRDRNPYDASLCEQDALNTPVASIIAQRHQAGECILLVSARQECHREPTERWLQTHAIAYTALWMRPTGDPRKDFLVKEEIYKEQIEGRYRIVFALDDRNQTVAFWRSLGIATFQVAAGDF